MPSATSATRRRHHHRLPVRVVTCGRTRSRGSWSASPGSAISARRWRRSRSRRCHRGSPRPPSAHQLSMQRYRLLLRFRGVGGFVHRWRDPRSQLRRSSSRNEVTRRAEPGRLRRSGTARRGPARRFRSRSRRGWWTRCSRIAAPPGPALAIRQAGPATRVRVGITVTSGRTAGVVGAGARVLRESLQRLEIATARDALLDDPGARGGRASTRQREHRPRHYACDQPTLPLHRLLPGDWARVDAPSGTVCNGHTTGRSPTRHSPRVDRRPRCTAEWTRSDRLGGPGPGPRYL